MTSWTYNEFDPELYGKPLPDKTWYAVSSLACITMTSIVYVIIHKSLKHPSVINISTAIILILVYVVCLGLVWYVTRIVRRRKDGKHLTSIELGADTLTISSGGSHKYISLLTLKAFVVHSSVLGWYQITLIGSHPVSLARQISVPEHAIENVTAHLARFAQQIPSNVYTDKIVVLWLVVALLTVSVAIVGGAVLGTSFF